MVFVYYAGHGAMDSETSMILNGASTMYPLEKMLRVLAGMSRTFVVALLDCCREKVDSTKWRGTNNKADVDPDLLALFAMQDDIQQKNTTNYLITYGCPPDTGVPAKSTIAVAYFKFLNSQKDNKGKVTLPGNIGFFQGTDGKCESVPKCSQSIRLQWKIEGKGSEIKTVQYNDCSYTGTVNANGKRHGKGKLVFKSGTSYEGEFNDGTYEGNGIMKFANGSTYDGEWKAGVRSGFGESTYANGDRFNGTFAKDKKHGEGSYFYKNGNAYVGGWDMDTRHGKGTYTFANGEYYNGDYEHNTRHGYGSYKNANGETYEGMYVTNKKHGKGTYTYSTGAKYVGMWEDDKKSGQGVYTFSNGETYTGQYANGVRDGQGKFQYKNGDAYNGPWKNDKKHGVGLYTFKNGKVKNGEFNNGDFVKWI